MSEEALAKHWGVTTRYVRILREEEVAVFKGGKYDLVESDRRLINWLKTDEPTQRVKRELLVAQIQAKERKLQREDRELLRPDEIKKYIDQAWSNLWLGLTWALNHLYSDVRYRGAGNEDVAWQAVHGVNQRVKGELQLTKERLETLHGATLATLDCELRNGIIVNAREIRRLEAALGESGKADDE